MYFSEKFINCLLVNCGPLSVYRNFGIPRSTNNPFIFLITAVNEVKWSHRMIGLRLYWFAICKYHFPAIVNIGAYVLPRVGRSFLLVHRLSWGACLILLISGQLAIMSSMSLFIPVQYAIVWTLNLVFFILLVMHGVLLECLSAVV